MVIIQEVLREEEEAVQKPVRQQEVNQEDQQEVKQEDQQEVEVPEDQDQLHAEVLEDPQVDLDVLREEDLLEDVDAEVEEIVMMKAITTLATIITVIHSKAII